MLGKISLTVAILAIFSLTVTEALASRTDSHHGGYQYTTSPVRSGQSNTRSDHEGLAQIEP